MLYTHNVKISLGPNFPITVKPGTTQGLRKGRATHGSLADLSLEFSRRVCLPQKLPAHLPPFTSHRSFSCFWRKPRAPGSGLENQSLSQSYHRVQKATQRPGALGSSLGVSWDVPLTTDVNTHYRQIKCTSFWVQFSLYHLLEERRVGSSDFMEWLL